MATKSWTGGANDNNFMTAGNWSGGVAPVNTDDLIISATNQAITAGLVTGITPNSVIFGAGFGGPGVGGAGGTPLTFIGVCPLVVWGASAARLNISTTGTITALRGEHSGGKVFVGSGTYGTVTNSNGDMDIDAAATISTELINLRGNITLGANGTAIPKTENGGYIQTARSLATANATDVVNVHGGGKIRTTDTAAIGSNANSVLASAWSGGTIEHLGSGALCAYAHSGGTVTLQNNQNATMTITGSKQSFNGTFVWQGIPSMTITGTPTVVGVGQNAGNPLGIFR